MNFIKQKIIKNHKSGGSTCGCNCSERGECTGCVMKMQSLKIEPFNHKNLSYILDVVVPLWSSPEWEEDFRRFNVEYIVRNNIFENKYCFELVEECNSKKSNFLSAAFFARKGDVCKADLWFLEKSRLFQKSILENSSKSATFLKLMDERTLGLMNDDDIKLSLFVSVKPGYGSLILEELYSKLKTEGWKNLYLWTDCECNWQWYIKHGFTLVAEDTYLPFCSPDFEYKTYIFKRKL